MARVMVMFMVMVMVMGIVRLTARDLSVLALALGLGLRVAFSVSVSIRSQTRHYEPHRVRDTRVRFPIHQQSHEVPFLLPCCPINCRSTILHTTGVGWAPTNGLAGHVRGDCSMSNLTFVLTTP